MTMKRNRLSKTQWEQLRTAYCAGAGLRELARGMGLSENTVTSYARRHSWSRQLQEAKSLPFGVSPPPASPVEAAASSLQERGQRHRDRMARVVEKTLPHVEAMDAADILATVKDIDVLDRIGRRTFGLDDGTGGSIVQINVALGALADLLDG
jgi:hypothetical protein